jgi:hypothetical protein
MADEFGQRIHGIFAAGDTIVSTDKHIAVYGKLAGSPDTYQYLELSSNGLLVDVANIGTVTVSGTVAVSGVTGDVAVVNGTTAFAVGATTNYEYTTATAWANTHVGAYTLAVRKDADAALVADGEYGPLQTDANGFLKVAGSLSITQPNSTYHAGSATLVKDTANTVVTRTTAADEYYSGVMVSGAGYCQWDLESPAGTALLSFWTTPSHPTEYVDLPDYLKILSGAVIRVRGTNREKAASTGSDFTGYATLIRKA